ncbi:DNA internalization-related competence protein ComEC/Rec2 [uncultured Secundilactobacillus sp.]|uniref:DNA internalization-related competence protein ComEC/Rec2 n=1 Tax=uncultured Secundilactobacillus sp. TaxID=2813935 RepID=UPI00338ED519
MLLILWSIRIICLRNRQILIICLLVGVGFTGWFSFRQQQVLSRALPSAANQALNLTVQPDELIKRDGRLQLKAHLPNGQPVDAVYFLPEDSLQSPLENRHQTMVISVIADVADIPKATNVNEFDYQRYQAQNGIMNDLKITRFTGIANARATTPVQWWQNACHGVRAWMIRLSNQLPKTLRLYVQGLFLGYRADNFYDELKSVTDLGLIHLFSISGFHVYWVIGLFSAILNGCRVPRRVAIWLLMLALPHYYLMAGAAPSLLRAILVAFLGLIAEAGHRSWTPLTVFGISLLVGLGCHPALLVQMGGQLSYLLALTLIFTAKQSLMVRTLFLNLVSLPVIIFHVYQWHALTLLANLLILPIFSWVVFPLTLLAGILGLMVPSIAMVTDRALAGFNWGLDQLAALPGMVLFGKPSIWLLTGTLILTFVTLAAKKRRWLVTSLVGCYVVMFMLIHFPKTGEVTFFDIGQGDSFLVRTPFNRQIIMIDTGGKPQFGGRISHGRTRAEKVSLNYLKSLGIDHLDALCLSHQDADHVGDIVPVLSTLRVKTLYIPLGMDQNPQFMRRLAAFKTRLRIIPVKAGDAIGTTGFKVVHPFKAGLGENQDSMVLHGQFGQLRFLFTGDLGREGEREIMTHYPGLQTDVLKLGHHGSKTSSDPAVVAQLHPSLSVISAGRKNRYGHPNQETLTMLSQQQIPYYNTQVNGMIRYQYTSGHSGKWQSYLKEAPGSDLRFRSF